MMERYANADVAELDKFSRLAAIWWDKNGSMGMLHQINPLRVNFISRHADLIGVKVLDVGCGGGILSESLAKRGALVTGIDLSEAALEVATQHARMQNLEIDYRLEDAEALAQRRKGYYDVVLCMEMLEHVPCPKQTIAACAALLRSGGACFFSTIDRSLKSFVCAILIGEYILRILPRGTHSYHKLIKPSQLQNWSERNHLQLTSTASLIYNPFSGCFKLREGLDMNYLTCYRKINETIHRPL
ncbi:MAG: bifunctional 2-polyprenyl-6-hydroxyphenol methylase/3-demethylubiquinol 3-O-methyltransferase UbiG [Alphaproteobacteria bacterium]|nr:MAG: bifunctional 2-polyprenyl-6-hydroxyphenol methylase/3-demethylubiquinol 3-O-methyltransferase UbiG [Alphaproteobacteria bacterium]